MPEQCRRFNARSHFEGTESACWGRAGRGSALVSALAPVLRELKARARSELRPVWLAAAGSFLTRELKFITQLPGIEQFGFMKSLAVCLSFILGTFRYPFPLSLRKHRAGSPSMAFPPTFPATFFPSFANANLRLLLSRFDRSPRTE